MNFATSAANQLAQTAPLNLSTERPLCGAFSSGFQSTCFAGLSWALRQSSFNTALLNIQSPFLTDLPSPLRLPSAAPLTMGCTEADFSYQEFSSIDSPPATDWGALSKWLDLQSGGGPPSPEFKLADGSQVEEEPKPNFNYIGELRQFRKNNASSAGKNRSDFAAEI
ncbi:unnamed protein product [Dibothriocephalus latus]|uniref:Uncharacterized protein n=1 Tax=Dibothriocephalus latus TaxID=60516 RepID=A0A3P7PHU7_DIBLA|nr:unnamed protein product [Dibothriocephalus latus]